MYARQDPAAGDVDVRWQNQENPAGVCHAVVYARTSGQESKSIKEQLAIGRQRCDERGWKVRYVLADEGMSGGDAERPGYNALWEHVLAGRVQVLVAWKIDRVARSLAEMASLEEILRGNGVALHSCSEPIDTTTAQGRFVFGVIAAAGEMEREIGSQRVREILTVRASRGMWMHPIPPFGYCLGKGRALRKHPTEAGIVAKVFQIHRSAGSYAEAASQLRQAGITRRGRPWTAGTVQRVIENTIHIGRYTHWGQTVERPALRVISDEDWEASITVRQGNPRRGRPASQRLREESIDRVMQQYIAGLDYLDEPS